VLITGPLLIGPIVVPSLIIRPAAQAALGLSAIAAKSGASR
jgi:hypothetical protein